MKKNKKILIATPLYPPQVGGPASRTVLLEKRFPEMGFSVSVAKFSTVLKFPKIIRHIIYFFMLLVKGMGANIILAQDPVSTGLPSLLASRILMKKFVLIIVGDYAWEQGSQRAGVTDLLDAFSTENEKYPMLVRILKRTQLFVASHADKIIVPSNYLKRIVANWGVPSEKITVIYNSFDPPKVSAGRNEIREKLGLTGNILVSAGRLVPWKGFGALISKVMPKVLDKFQETKLFIIGDGPDKAYLENLIKLSKLDNKVILTGRKPQAELFDYIRASNVFVLNTAYEGMSHQLLEVMALETPIVTTDIGGNLEVVKNDENGILVHYNDADKMSEAIIKLLGDNQLAGRLVMDGNEKIKGFTEEKMLKELATALQ